MRITHLTRLLRPAALATALATALLCFGPAQPAAADAPDLAFTVDQPVTTPGSAVSLTMTLTNNQSTDIWFVYQSVQPTWATTQRKDLVYSFVSCTAEGAACSGIGSTALGVDYEIPLAPGTSRTVTLTYQVAADSGCNGTIGFYSYLYYEYDNGQSTKDGIHAMPETRVACAPTEPAGS
ncbi:hypothetical protein [Streptomyces pacificus]|uniref:Secreted protein n=1 Tax=Streptomyces pacificus TaxID=2705029 RepID=A0A6A0ANR9_9ACTN|nr:hypothetical protein [Streptomyces pacificus]GFH34619.1 hypothetical protein SCWH03_08330 [Streptomyces pacificus]